MIIDLGGIYMKQERSESQGRRYHHDAGYFRIPSYRLGQQRQNDRQISADRQHSELHGRYHPGKT